MWIVELALRRPYTFVVMAIAIVLFGVLSLCRMAIDIFPNIDIPVVSCCWTYTGMSPYYMENMVTTVTERALTSTVNGIQRMESVSLSGMSIVKVYLQQGTNIGQSVAMVTSVGTAILKQLPRGISPPFVTSSSATDVPVLQLSLHSQKHFAHAIGHRARSEDTFSVWWQISPGDDRPESAESGGQRFVRSRRSAGDDKSECHPPYWHSQDGRV
jgi:multidrug efflux pump subunit AcrB